MYEKFFGLTRSPFDLTPNPEYLFLTASHREALSNLEYGISARVGLTLLVGDAGMGKTTLIRAALNARRSQGGRVVYLNNPTLTRSEFIEFLAREFQLGREASTSKSTLVFELERALLRSRDVGQIPAMIIDEAQSLPHELLEEVRLLANIETATEKLLPIVLVGQPELAEQLNRPVWRQLKQRVGLRCQLKPLDVHETAAYIATRLRVAEGNAAAVFTREAVVLIHERSKGIPRTISVICHNALISGFALNRRPVATEIVREVCRDFDLDDHTTVRGAERSEPHELRPPMSGGKEKAAAVGVGGAAGMGEDFENAGGSRRRFWLR